MNALSKAIEGLKSAKENLDKIMRVSGIDIYEETIKVQVASLRDLEQIPGEVTYSDSGNGYEYPIKAKKVYKGVLFLCVLTREEYARIA